MRADLIPTEFPFPWLFVPLLLATLVLVFVVNGYWLYVKWSLHREGKRVSLIDHGRDFRLLREVIAESESETRRKRFEELLFRLRCLAWATMICAGLHAGYFLLFVAYTQMTH